MTSGLTRQVWKEVRVLGAGWLACLAAVAMMGVLNQMPATLALLAYAVGPIALGALSIGHEYNHRTLSHLLVQPVSRVRILSVKTVVLGVLLAVLWASAGWSATSAGRLDPGPISGYVWATWIFPILAGFCLAPWLTMLCRSALAGLVFAMATPAAIWIGAVLLTVARFGVEAADTPAAEAFRLALLWAGMLAASLAGIVLTWRAFIGLEALEGRGEDVALPAWLQRRAASGTRRRRPAVWHLVLKEIRLQQMTFVVSVLFATYWLLWPLLREALPAAAPAGSLQALVLAHGGFVSLLAGSLASAEERQYDTREWQLLLPMASTAQWAAKAATAIGVALVLAIGVPAALNTVSSAGPLPARPGSDLAAAAMGVSILTAGSLYVSSLSTSGVRAVIASVIAVPIAVPLANALMSLSMQALWTVAAMMGASRPVPGPSRWVGWLNGAILVVLLVRSGLVNHRTNAVAWPRVVRQVLSIGGWIVIATVVAALAG